MKDIFKKLDWKHFAIIALIIALVYFVWKHNGIKGAYSALLRDIGMVDDTKDTDVKAVKGKHDQGWDQNPWSKIQDIDGKFLTGGCLNKSGYEIPYVQNSELNKLSIQACQSACAKDVYCIGYSFTTASLTEGPMGGTCRKHGKNVMDDLYGHVRYHLQTTNAYTEKGIDKMTLADIAKIDKNQLAAAGHGWLLPAGFEEGNLLDEPPCKFSDMRPLSQTEIDTTTEIARCGLSLYYGNRGFQPGGSVAKGPPNNQTPEIKLRKSNLYTCYPKPT